jgi:phytanoyl-CoA hydroxylase
VTTPAINEAVSNEFPGDFFSEDEIAQFRERGFVVVRGLGTSETLRRMMSVVKRGLAEHIAPIEYEAELQYPGSPVSFEAEGGRTIRRLKQALTRDYVFTEWLGQPALVRRLQQILGPKVVCPLAHHNCVMTKQPAYSSETGWHQDIRYWSYTKPDLVNVWLALGDETRANGCLQMIPGSHREKLSRDRLDDALFFRTDLPENAEWIARREYIELEQGDVVFFHCLALHAADRNTTGDTKISVVFTFRGGDNHPVAGSRSASMPELLLTPSIPS